MTPQNKSSRNNNKDVPNQKLHPNVNAVTNGNATQRSTEASHLGQLKYDHQITLDGFFGAAREILAKSEDNPLRKRDISQLQILRRRIDSLIKNAKKRNKK